MSKFLQTVEDSRNECRFWMNGVSQRDSEVSLRDNSLTFNKRVKSVADKGQPLGVT